ncbi:MAG: hypothetical protein ACRYF7_03765 [Janthinobacterium lividum]|jgi:hypothetical protein|uniref:Uncharacterized protein n=1 Tax=Massilia varians TaxID=457921 RepID=A0ABM8CCD7_9BURK|nr:hypothetical protein [Massilia varians]BDT60975.1 hypothetical protein MasN3_44690 [Massilia varians]
MSDSYELVPLAHLYPGMVLADALLDAHGKVLLAEGAVLGEATILSLSRHGVGAAPIRRAAPPSQPDPGAVQARLDHLFRRNDRDDHADWATGLLRRYVEDYRLRGEVAP